MAHVTLPVPDNTAKDMAQWALWVWEGELGAISDDLKGWLYQAAGDVRIMWDDVFRMNRAREMWKALSNAVESADPTNPWNKVYDRLYFDSQLFAVMRVAVSDKREVSLASILRWFKRHPEMCAEMKWDRIPDDHRSAINPQNDHNRLGRLVAPLEPWRNKRVGHIEREAVIPDVTWEDLDAAITGVTELLNLYASRIHGARVQADYDEPYRSQWKSVFMAPLFDAEGKPSRGGGEAPPHQP